MVRGVTPLVLSLFPGGGFLDYAFEREGFTVVRGPDVIWGGDIRRFHPPAGRFDGIIGGPPCQCFSPISNVNRKRYGDESVGLDLIPEFARCVTEAEPAWYVMENSPRAYAPFPEAREIRVENSNFGAEQRRLRSFWSNLPLEVKYPFPIPCGSGTQRTVSSKSSVDWKGSRSRESRRDLAEMLRLQGYPADYFGDHSPFTVAGMRKMVGNGVPRWMGQALARAVLDATRN